MNSMKTPATPDVLLAIVGFQKNKINFGEIYQWRGKSCFNPKENPILLLVKVQRFYIAASNSSSMLCHKHFVVFFLTLTIKYIFVGLS